VRFPEFCEAQIQIDITTEICVATPQFTESAWPIELPILCGTKSIGRITLRYNLANLPPDQDHWTTGEERFLSEVCSLIALKLSNSDKIQRLEKSALEKKELAKTNSSQRELLDDVLPSSVVDTMLETGEAPPPQKYNCTILFTDVVGFTDLCSRATPLCIVKMLNDMYTAFDTLVTQGGDDLYKVETIGDSYMVVSGLPETCVCHAAVIVQLALDFIDAMSNIKITLKDGTMVPIQIRCGINSGEVVASVVGTINPRYCLIGDAVNTASRMESTSETMNIQISQSTRECIELHRLRPVVVELLKKVRFVPRYAVEIKGKDPMDTFWVEKND
jgi:class 3 adenylate cyclase